MPFLWPRAIPPSRRSRRTRSPSILRQPPFSDWLAEDREFLLWRDRLSQARTAFEADERGLLTGRELAIVRSYLQTRAERDFDAADLKFIRDSIVADDKRRADEAEEQRKREAAKREEQERRVRDAELIAEEQRKAADAERQAKEAAERTAAEQERAAAAERQAKEAAERTATEQEGRRGAKAHHSCGAGWVGYCDRLGGSGGLAIFSTPKRNAKSPCNRETPPMKQRKTR
jgi:hypothetical protein